LSCGLPNGRGQRPEIVVDIRNLEAGNPGGDPDEPVFVFHELDPKLPPLAGRIRLHGSKAILGADNSVFSIKET